MRKQVRILLTLVLFFAGASASMAAELWFGDNNMAQGAGMPTDFKEMFTKPDSWKEARKYIDVYLMRANTLMAKKNGVTDAFLRDHFVPVLKKSNIAIALEFRRALEKLESKKVKPKTKYFY